MVTRAFVEWSHGEKVPVPFPGEHVLVASYYWPNRDTSRVFEVVRVPEIEDVWDAPSIEVREIATGSVEEWLVYSLAILQDDGSWIQWGKPDSESVEGRSNATR